MQVRSSKAIERHSVKEISPQPEISCRTIWSSRAHWTRSTKPTIILQQTKDWLLSSSALTSRRCSLMEMMFVCCTKWSQTPLQEQLLLRNGIRSRGVRSHTFELYSTHDHSLPCSEGKS